MVKRGLFLLIFAVVFISGCIRPSQETPEQSLIKKVNADDKNFRGIWVYKSQIAGQFTLSVRTKINIEVNGKKFRLTGKWGINNPPDQRRTEEWIYDGKILWQLIPSQKQVNWLEIKEFRKGPFWKMPLQIKPFPPPRETGKEEVVAGRICRVLQTKGKYQRGDVTLIYWVDKEKNLLLKKEHLLKREDLTLIHEIYECQNIEFDPVFSSGRFEVNVPSNWVKVKKRYLDCELLNTKF